MEKELEKYWVELSEYDLVTADAMLSTGRYLYVGFMCHQVIEKILKAYYCNLFSENAPYTRSLSMLASKTNLYDEFTENIKDFIDELEPLNIEARYPAYKERLLKSLDEAKCIQLILNTKDLQLWIKQKLLQAN